MSFLPVSEYLLKRWQEPAMPWGRKPLSAWKQAAIAVATLADALGGLALLAVTVNAVILGEAALVVAVTPPYDGQRELGGGDPACKLTNGSIHATLTSSPQLMPDTRVTYDVVGTVDGKFVHGKSHYETTSSDEPGRPLTSSYNMNDPKNLDRVSDLMIARNMLKRCHVLLNDPSGGPL